MRESRQGGKGPLRNLYFILDQREITLKTSGEKKAKFAERDCRRRESYQVSKENSKTRGNQNQSALNTRERGVHYLLQEARQLANGG